MLVLALIALAYLCGSLPTGVWLSRRRGVDPRDVGSGSTGATNVARAAGLGAGALTLVGDCAKGLVPVLLALRLGHSDTVAALAGLAAFLGHLYSVFLGFGGGKGVATAFGVFLGLAPMTMLVVLPLFVVTAVVSRYVSLASLVAAIAVPPLLIAWSYPRPTVVVGTALVVLIVVRHRDNLRRLRFGTEARIERGRRAPRESGVA